MGVKDVEKAKQAGIQQAIEEEAILLAGAMRDEELASLVVGMREMDFAYPRHRSIFRLIRELAAAGEPIGMSTINRQALRDGVQELIGGPAFIADVSESFVGKSFCLSAYKSVIDYSMRRALLNTCERLHDLAMVPSEDTVQLIDNAILFLQTVKGGL